ncbi:MAG: hypothetical protein PV358_14750 [Acidimicrobiales bacterium]|nr:hypothetical protein [Acidimicrobiales bacterium]
MTSPPGRRGPDADTRPDPGAEPDLDARPDPGAGPGDAVDTDARAASGDDTGDTAPRSARILVAVLFVLLLVPGIIGFDLWPLTGWRLFSLSRGAEQSFWVLEAVDGDGERQLVSLEELPLRYRHAAWPIAELRGASAAERDALCQALLDPVVDMHPDTVELAIGHDHAELVEREGEWSTTHDIEPFLACGVDGTLVEHDRAAEGS